MPFFEAIQSQIIVGQVELVSEKFRSCGEPGSVTNPVDADTSEYPPIALQRVVHPNPVLNTNHWMDGILFSNIQRSFKRTMHKSLTRTLATLWTTIRPRDVNLIWKLGGRGFRFENQGCRGFYKFNRQRHLALRNFLESVLISHLHVRTLQAGI